MNDYDFEAEFLRAAQVVKEALEDGQPASWREICACTDGNLAYNALKQFWPGRAVCWIGEKGSRRVALAPSEDRVLGVGCSECHVAPGERCVTPVRRRPCQRPHVVRDHAVFGWDVEAGAWLDGEAPSANEGAPCHAVAGVV